MLIAGGFEFDFMSTLSRMVGHMYNDEMPPVPTEDLNPLIRLLDVADASAGAAALRARSYELLHIAPGVRAVDVGCGTGRAVAEMNERGAEAVGIDASVQMIDEGRRRRPDLDLRVGDAYELSLPDGSVAAYRADKVYHELDDPAKALGEAFRVLTPGGRIALIGQDWESFIIDSDTPAITRTIVQARADTVPNPRAARRYRNLLLDAGFEDVAVEVRTGIFTDATMLPMLSGIAEGASAAGALDREQADMWTAEQATRAKAGRLFLAIPLFLASAGRP
ncbi:methyltransferase domain-containing protein [Microbispora catharanthi]|uniref:methyltransferase domain-containing protein n=1 Tax=Microbispora catharanthi TaxID=1712871 RepID=UPI00197C8804|nr:methyltransferase domain-containing protein [Microbispora catharanthi]